MACSALTVWGLRHNRNIYLYMNRELRLYAELGSVATHGMMEL